MADTHRIANIADMTADQLKQSPEALAVLTQIGELAERNRDLADLEGDRKPTSRSHNFVVGGGLSDTQRLALTVLRDPSLMRQIPLTMEQAEVIVDAVHEQSTKEMAMGTRILARITEYSDRPQELLSSPTSMAALQTIGEMAENNGDYKKYAAQDPSLNPSSRSHNVYFGSDPHMSDTQRLGLLIIQNEMSAPGVRLPPDRQKVVQEIGHQYLIDHPAKDAPKPDGARANLQNEGRGSNFQVPTLGIPTGEPGSPFGGTLNRAGNDSVHHGSATAGEASDFGPAEASQKRDRSRQPLKTAIGGAGIPTGEPGSPSGGTLNGTGSDVNHGGLKPGESGNFGPAAQPSVGDVYKQGVKLPNVDPGRNQIPADVSETVWSANVGACENNCVPLLGEAGDARARSASIDALP